MLAFVYLFWRGPSLSSRKMDLELEWQPSLYHESREETWTDGWAEPLSSKSVLFPGWESGLQVGDEGSTGAEEERGLGGHGRLSKPGRPSG